MAAVSDITHRQVFDGLRVAVESAASVDGWFRMVDRAIDPNTAPATRLSRGFSIEMQSRDSGKYRDNRIGRIRVNADVLVRLAWRVNPKDEPRTYAAALDDEDLIVRTVLGATFAPIVYSRRVWQSTRRSMASSREWYFADVLFGVEFDRSLTEGP